MERQARYRDRKNAELAAQPDDPITAGIPTFEPKLTLDDALKAAGTLGSLVLSVYEESIAEAEE